jgi:predicted esterase
MRLPDTSLDPHGPLAFWGYSQGGGAAASAAELASSYAPELDVVGSYAGAPPADLKALFRTLFDLQRIGKLKPNAPVLINSNRFDPLVPWTGASQLGRDWCAQGADVEFRTNEEPPFLNKLVINHALPMLVDGEAAMQWIADRFNGVPTTPNCGQF